MAAPRPLPPRTVLARFPALQGRRADYALNRIDAFFLPFRPLGGVLRPGRELEIALVRLP